VSNGRYILKRHEAVLCDDLLEWATAFEDGKSRIVCRTTIGDSDVSTVFLALDHQWGDGPPLLFETMVFGGPLDQEQERYATWEEAEAGHASMVERVNSSKITV